jgi:uncharacterized membrane protein
MAATRNRVTLIRQVVLRAFRRFCLTLLSRKVESALGVSVVLCGLVLSYLTLVKYYTFHVTGWDLGVFSQSFYTTVNFGSLFSNNLEFGSHFHVHFQPILFLILPFYAVSQSPPTLLVIQASAVALGAIPLYYLARQELDNRRHALAFAVLYLLYAPLYGAAFFDFHPEAFTPLLCFTTLYFFKKGKWPAYFTFLMLLLCVKEDIALVAVAIGAYGICVNLRALFKKKINRVVIASVATVVVGIGWLFLSSQVISYFVVADGYGSLWNYGYSHHTANVYRNIGGEGGMLGVISCLLSDPSRIVGQLMYLPSEKVTFLAVLFVPTCMFAFLDIPAVLLLLPTLLEFTLAGNPSYFSVLYHYTFQLTPVILVATVYGFKKVLEGCRAAAIGAKVAKRLFFIMFIATLVTLSLTGNMIANWWKAPLTVTETDRMRGDLISLIPLHDNPRILTQNDYFPHVSNSRYSYAYWNATDVDYILIDVSSNWYAYQDPAPAEYVARFGEQTRSFNDRVKSYVEGGDFGLTGQVDGLLLYEKGFNGSLSIYVPYRVDIGWKKLFFNALVLEESGSISQKVILHRAIDGSKKAFWYGPYISMPPGTYEANFRLKIASPTQAYVLTLDVTKDSGEDLVARSALTGADFSEVGVWQEFTLSFTLEKPAFSVEFRGVQVSNVTDVYLDCVMIRQVAPLSW